MYSGEEVNEGETLTLKLVEQPKEIWAAMKKRMEEPYVPLKRKEFYYDAIPVQVNDEAGEYLIRGTMRTSHKPTVKISLFPTNPNRLAPAIKKEILGKE